MHVSYCISSHNFTYIIHIFVYAILIPSLQFQLRLKSKWLKNYSKSLPERTKSVLLIFLFRFLSSTIVATLWFLFLELAGLIQRVIWNHEHDAPLILPENMLLKSANFMYFVVTMYRLPKQHALRTQATYTTKALALQRAKDHCATFRDTRDISSPKCRFQKFW